MHRAENVGALSGEERNLGEGWPEDAVEGFLTGTDDAAAPGLEVRGLRVSTASPRVILALKVLAHRVGEDDDDVSAPRGASGHAAAAEVLEVAQAAYGDRLDVAARFFVEEIFV